MLFYVHFLYFGLIWTAVTRNTQLEDSLLSAASYLSVFCSTFRQN